MNHFTTDRRPMSLRQRDGQGDSQGPWLTAAILRWGPAVLLALILPLLPQVVEAGQPWQWMVGLAVGIYSFCKWLTWRDEVFESAWRSWGYLTLWPGMDPSPFADSDQPAVPTRAWMLAWGLTKMLAGLALVLFVAPASTDHPLLAGWLAMAGLVMLLHFGLFDVLACGWRRAGVDLQPIMLQPARSQSLGEFWGRRWNRSFNELVVRWVYQPSLRTAGPRVAMLLVFVVSGLVHELVITVPARAGHGLPTLYFMIQGAALLLQKTRFARRWHLDRGLIGRVITLGVVIAPLGLLFPPPFVLDVILPILRTLGIDV